MQPSSERQAKQGQNWFVNRRNAITRLCAINEVTSKHILSREDYAACMLDSLENPEHYRRSLTVVSAEGYGRSISLRLSVHTRCRGDCFTSA
jgi:hypothetical protein